jgi:hypothetical protein
MTFIKDKVAFKTAQLYWHSGQEVIAVLYLRKAYGVK